MAKPEKKLPAKWKIWKLLLPPTGYDYFKDWEMYKFKPVTSKHSPVNAWWLAECAMLAYEDKPNIESVLTEIAAFKSRGKLKWDWLNEGSTQGFIVEADKFVVLSLRGTEFYPINKILTDPRRLWGVAKDIRTDADLLLEKPTGDPAIGYNVARGFYREFKSIWKQVKTFIEASSDKPVWITGHSLGAALATLVAFQLGKTQLEGLYTYGSPCVGDDNFTAEFKRRRLGSLTYRYVNGNDLIAKSLPFWRKSIGYPNYQHVGTSKTIERKSFLFNPLIKLDITDHAPIYYAIQTWNMI